MSTTLDPSCRQDADDLLTIAIDVETAFAPTPLLQPES